ncbi:hypothetical protein CapIbe_017680 [Capra ibex]
MRNKNQELKSRGSLWTVERKNLKRKGSENSHTLISPKLSFVNILVAILKFIWEVDEGKERWQVVAHQSPLYVGFSRQEYYSFTK